MQALCFPKKLCFISYEDEKKTEERNIIRKCNKSNIHTRTFETMMDFRPGISRY
jgi:hypothetical protein